MLQETGEGGKGFQESGEGGRGFEPVRSLFNSFFLSRHQTVYVRVFYLTVVTTSDDIDYIDKRRGYMCHLSRHIMPLELVELIQFLDLEAKVFHICFPSPSKVHTSSN